MSKIHLQKTCDSYLNCSAPKTILFEKRGYEIFECQQCGHRFLKIGDPLKHLDDTYSDDYFYAGKKGYPNYLEEKEILTKRGLRYAKLISKYTQPGKVLDIGSAAGFILKGFDQSGWDCVGVEPNDTMAAYGRKELGLKIQTGSFESFHTDEQFDLINMIQVIGHFYDIDKALKNAAQFLKPGGLVLVESWNMKSAVARILGKRWHEYSPPSVIHWFSDKTLKGLFEQYGFELVDKGHPIKKLNAKHAFSFLKGKAGRLIVKRKFFGAMSRLLGRMTLIYPLRDVKWYIFRKKQ